MNDLRDRVGVLLSLLDEIARTEPQYAFRCDAGAILVRELVHAVQLAEAVAAREAVKGNP